MPNAFNEKVLRRAQTNYFDHMLYAKRRGFDLDTEGMEAVLTRRDGSLVLRVPLEVLADRFGLSRLGL